MVKRSTPNNLAKQSSFVLFSLFLIFISSCQKDLLLPEEGSITPELTTVQQWFNKNDRLLLTAEENWLKTLSPNWGKVYHSETETQNILKFR